MKKLLNWIFYKQKNQSEKPVSSYSFRIREGNEKSNQKFVITPKPKVYPAPQDKKIICESFIDIKEQLPEKGKDILAICSDGDKAEVFRCACPNKNCTEWRCSFTGYGMIIEVEKWKYI